jgi:hypothetical protein
MSRRSNGSTMTLARVHHHHDRVILDGLRTASRDRSRNRRRIAGLSGRDRPRPPARPSLMNVGNSSGAGWGMAGCEPAGMGQRARLFKTTMP